MSCKVIQEGRTFAAGAERSMKHLSNLTSRTVINPRLTAWLFHFDLAFAMKSMDMHVYGAKATLVLCMGHAGDLRAM